MKSLIIATATMLCFFSANAQTETIPVEAIQKFLNKAVGQKFESNGDIKITKQVISETTYTLYKKRNGTKWVAGNTNIQWDNAVYFKHYKINGNDKLTVCRFSFSNEMNWFYHVESETETDKLTIKYVEFYILTIDYYDFVDLMKKFIHN